MTEPPGATTAAVAADAERPRRALPRHRPSVGPRPDHRPAGPVDSRGLAARLLLPEPVSAAHGRVFLLLGFVTEGATEAFQFLERGDLVQGPIVYYTTLATTLLGFYLMFLGLRERRAFPAPPGRTVPVAPGRPGLPLGLALGVGGTAATLALVALLGGGGGGSPLWIVGPVGGLVVLALGRFFLGLRKESYRPGAPWRNLLGWAASGWSLGVAVIAGWVVGERTVRLLGELVSNWVQLVASVGPFVVAMSPLCVTYALLVGAFWPVGARGETGPGGRADRDPATEGAGRLRMENRRDARSVRLVSRALAPQGERFAPVKEGTLDTARTLPGWSAGSPIAASMDRRQRFVDVAGPLLGGYLGGVGRGLVGSLPSGEEHRPLLREREERPPHPAEPQGMEASCESRPADHVAEGPAKIFSLPVPGRGPAHGSACSGSGGSGGM